MSKAGIKICPKCSGVKKRKLKDAGISKGDFSCGCIGVCHMKDAGKKGEACARIDGKLVFADSKGKLIKKIKKALEE